MDGVFEGGISSIVLAEELLQEARLFAGVLFPGVSLTGDVPFGGFGLLSGFSGFGLFEGAGGFGGLCRGLSVQPVRGLLRPLIVLFRRLAVELGGRSEERRVGKECL